MCARTNGTSVRISHGMEGPSHDPYVYERITVERLGRRVVIHRGSLSPCWVECNGRNVVMDDYDGEEAHLVFEELTGMDTQQAVNYFYRNWEPDPMDAYYGIGAM